MKKYLQFAWLSFQNLIEYRMNFAWEVFGTTLSTVIIYFFWVAVLGSGFTNSGYTPISIGLYYLFMTLVGEIAGFDFSRIANIINSGDLGMELVKPYNFQIKELSQNISIKLVRVVIILLIFIGLISVGFKYQFNSYNLIPIIISIIMAFFGKFYISMIIGSLGFWFKRVHGFGSLFWNLGGLFSGDLIPIDLLPRVFASVSLFLPFRYLAYFPVQIIIGRATQLDIYKGLFLQLVWVAAFAILYKIIWSKGLAHFDAEGK